VPKNLINGNSPQGTRPCGEATTHLGEGPKAFLLPRLEAGGFRKAEIDDQHIEGLFARAEWLKGLGEAGFEARSVVDPYERDLFVGVKPV
jgi:hypothetical protein